MYHFLYKTTHISGKYYVGRHSTNKLDDNYFGSGKWVRSLNDKSTLTREILKFCDPEELLTEEQNLLKEHVGKPNCMNFNYNPVGFSSGKLNPNSKENLVGERLVKARNRILGENNPSKRPEVRQKKSLSQKGRPSPKKGIKMSEEARINMSAAAKGRKHSPETKIKISESLKQKYINRKTKD